MATINPCGGGLGAAMSAPSGGGHGGGTISAPFGFAEREKTGTSSGLLLSRQLLYLGKPQDRTGLTVRCPWVRGALPPEKE